MKTSENNLRLGIDVGSTTLKIVVLDSTGQIIYRAYKRHKARINEVLKDEFSHLATLFPNTLFRINVCGSAGIGVSERLGLKFLQEVSAAVNVIKKVYPDTNVLIDLGGEDSKMVFFENHQVDIRMNGSCAGGTGAFIDQMADLMNISVEQLGVLALEHNTIYPIASRCGVFSKTDVQNLICRNIPKEDIAMSILYAVALQCVTSLARGYQIQPKVLCIGGPFTFIPALKIAFKHVLEMQEKDLILPENSEFFPAWGSALQIDENFELMDLSQLINQIKSQTQSLDEDTLAPLFSGEDHYKTWKADQNIKRLPKRELEENSNINVFLGIDSGSTTTKILILDENQNVVFTFYDSNDGNPLDKVIEGLDQFFKEVESKHVSVNFLSTAATGYGEDLIRSALSLDYGIVETMAHLSGAQYVDPNVSFVLDIGGQDIKSIFTENGIISNVELNEACSSGCGSFLQNFAGTMNLDLNDFSKEACMAKRPSDLGSRCTVFMNSKVKQALRQNAALGDIAAGLAYSVVKNCLFKVLKISNLNILGDNIVVQGGTFRNDAVFRALELVSEKQVFSTDYPELMGALGAALYAQKMWQNTSHISHFLGREVLTQLQQIQKKELHCKGCNNQCTVIEFKFGNGNVSYAGNKCEKIFFSKTSAKEKGFNAFDLKNQLLFGRSNGNVSSNAKTIGISRVLNMFENYPFWHTLFTKSGLNVVLSDESTSALFQKGVGFVMSDNICFPAKLVHGHILDLIEKKVDRIFYPMVIKDEKELEHTVNSFNCPVVSGYPDVVRSSMDPESRYGVPFDKPVLTFSNLKKLKEVCWTYMDSLGVEKSVFNQAFSEALKAEDDFKQDLYEQQKNLLDKSVENGDLLCIVAGRPYHADPLVHQKVGQTLADLGIHVLTDDVFRRDDSLGFKDLKIVSQWSYPNRAVNAALEVAKLPQNIQYIQLNSFGCGPDSFFMDEVGNILKQASKNHTILRIDEISSPGSIKLRLRSLIESLKASSLRSYAQNAFTPYPSSYTEKDKQKTILVPWLADFISPFLPAIGELAGYKMINLPMTNKISAEAGLKYGHNEVCYPSTLVLGDIITALQSGQYDLDEVVIAITQTGGQCRATNYLSQIKAGLENAGFSHIPVVVLSMSKVFQNEQKAFKLPLLKVANIAIYTVLYGDALQQMYNATIVREKQKGDTQNMFDFYVEEGIKAIRNQSSEQMQKLLEQAVADFNLIPVYDKEFTRVGLIGEIYVKYNHYGQAHVTEWLQAENIEVHSPPILDFILQYFINSETNLKNGVRRGSLLKYWLNPLLWKYMNAKVESIEKILKDFRFYYPAESIFTKAEYASEILDLSNQFGEGWSIAAEVSSYARHGINKVVCVQPFGCIANHIVAKGIEKRLKKFYPDMQLLYLDVDGGMAQVNLQNRLHFLIS